MNSSIINILVSILTSIVASIIFYFFNTYLGKRKQYKMLVEYIATEYQRTKTLILLEYIGNIPWHSAYEIEYTINNTTDYIKNIDNYQELKTYILTNHELADDYHNEYINSKMQELLYSLEHLVDHEFILFNRNIYLDLVSILRFIRNYKNDTHTIMNQFIFGYPNLCTTSQIHNAILNYSGCASDEFIQNLHDTYKKSLCYPLEKIINACNKLTCKLTLKNKK